MHTQDSAIVSIEQKPSVFIFTIVNAWVSGVLVGIYLRDRCSSYLPWLVSVYFSEIDS